MMDDSRNDIEQLVRDYEEKVAAGVSFYMDAADLMDVAEYYIKGSRYAEADNCIALALRLHPDDEDVLLMRAYRLKDDGRWQEATAIADSLSDRKNRDLQLFYVESLLSEMQPEAAEERFRSIVSGMQPPELYDWYVDFTEILLDYGFHLRAARWLEAFPGWGDSGYDMKHVCELEGEAWYQLHVFDRAVESLNRMIDLDPYDDESWTMLADAQYRSEKYRDAVDSCDYALAINADSARAYQLKLYAATQAGMPEVAVEAGRAYIARCPEDYSGYMMLGELLMETGDHAQAAELFSQAARYCPESQSDRPHVYSSLGACLLRTRHYQRALDALLCVSEPDNALWDTFAYVAETAIAQGDAAQGGAVFGQALRLVLPSPEQAIDAAQLIRSGEGERAARRFWGALLDRCQAPERATLRGELEALGRRYGVW